MIYFALLGALALQRLTEVKIGSANLERIRSRLVSEPDEKEKKQMIWLHAAWFFCCAVEHAIHRKMVSPFFFTVGIVVLALCQGVRFTSIRALGESWVHLPVAYRGQRMVSSGLYRWWRHPNYAVVAIEIALVPILANAYFTAFAFSLINALFLRRRIQMEEAQIEKARRL